jgi:hypothetical protein
MRILNSTLVHSLRWHYPDQIHGQGHAVPVSAELHSAPVAYLVVGIYYKAKYGIHQGFILPSMHLSYDVAGVAFIITGQRETQSLR